MPAGWESSSQPLPPINGQVSSPLMLGVLDVHWDDPAILAGNSAFSVVGVNVYRSDVSDRGPYHRIAAQPVGGTFYRDRTDRVYVSRELVRWDTSWVSKGNSPNDRRWVFRTRQPCIKLSSMLMTNMKPVPADSATDVVLHIDGVQVPVDTVFGPMGEITLINQAQFDDATEKYLGPVLPTEDSVVEVSYWASRNHVRSGLDGNIFYRLTTVVLDPSSPSGYRETDLSYCPPITLMAVENLDYIWREAVRRNEWIRQQGGERVKVFVRRQSGVRCFCRIPPKLLEYTKQPSQRCLTCFGTGFIGGYEGPYEIIIAPDDYERRITQGPNGKVKEHSGEVWTGPTPLLTQRDFIVKTTNERYSVGPVRRPSNRGNLLQQHFTIGYLDEKDIRYQVPVDGVSALPWPETRFSLQSAPTRAVDGSLPAEPDYPVGPQLQSPMGTNKTNIPAERQQRGRTPVWEDQNY